MFGENLLERRQYMGWTQKELAERCEMPAAAISHYETGSREPSLSSIVKLCNALHCEADELIYGFGKDGLGDLDKTIQSVRDILAPFTQHEWDRFVGIVLNAALLARESRKAADDA